MWVELFKIMGGNIPGDNFLSRNFPTGNLQSGNFIDGNFPDTSHTILVDTGRKLNVHKTFRTRPERLLNVLCTFSLRPVSTVILKLNLKTPILSSGFELMIM